MALEATLEGVAGGGLSVAERRDRLDDLCAARLIRRYQAGEVEAFVLLHDRYRPRVYEVAMKRLRCAQDADDVTQHVFCKVLQLIGAFDPEGRSFRRWLHKVAQNAAEDHWRRRRRSEGLAPEAIDRWVEASREDAPGWGDSIAVHEQIDQLSEAERRVLALRYRWELSARETAETLGQTEAGVRKTHTRALAKLRVQLGSRQAI